MRRQDVCEVHDNEGEIYRIKDEGKAELEGEEN
jgi:hypothetical protein